MATRFYLRNAAAEYTPPTIRGAWDQSAGAVAIKLDPLVNDAHASVSIVETNANNAWDVLLARAVSGPLAAQTLSGTMTILVPMSEPFGGAADLYFHGHVYVTQGDTDTPRGTLIADWVQAAGTLEFPGDTAASGRGFSAVSFTDLPVSAGDRIVVEIGYIARNAVTTSYAGVLHYGGDPFYYADLTGTSDWYETNHLRKGWIEFSGNLTFVSKPVRVSEVVVDTLNTISVPTRLSELTVEALVLGSVPLRNTALYVEVLEENSAAPAGGEVSFLWLE